MKKRLLGCLLLLSTSLFASGGKPSKCLNYPKMSYQYGSYNTAPVKVTEFTEIDLSVGHGNGLIGGGEIQHQPANRYLNNPVYNMVLDIFATANNQPGPEKNTVLYIPSYNVQLPECGACGYLSIFIPQYFSDAWLRKLDSGIGLVTGLNGTSTSLNAINFINKSSNPSYQQINHHTVFGIQSFPEYYYMPQSDKLALYGSVAEETYPDSLPEQQALISNLQMIFPPLPAFPKGSIPAQRRVATCAALINGAPRALVPYDQTNTVFAGFGREFSKIEFPYGYAAQLGGGDFAPVGWHYSNPIGELSSLTEGTKISLRTEFFVDFDFQALYQALIGALSPAAAPLIEAKFTQYGYDWNQGPEVAYKNINSTWAGTSDCFSEEFSIQPGKSTSYGRPTYLGARGQIVQVVPHFHDHTEQSALVVECDGKSTDLKVFYPKLEKNLAVHDSVPTYGNFGNYTNSLDLHNHMKKSHIPYRGLQDLIWSPGVNGPIVENPSTTVFRTVGTFDNLHDQMIDNMAISVIYWHALDGDCVMPVTSEPHNACAGIGNGHGGHS